MDNSATFYYYLFAFYQTKIEKVVDNFLYCYANSNMKLVKKNQKLHNHNSPLLIGEVKDDDVVNEVREPSYIDVQFKLF